MTKTQIRHKGRSFWSTVGFFVGSLLGLRTVRPSNPKKCARATGPQYAGYVKIVRGAGGRVYAIPVNAGLAGDWARIGNDWIPIGKDLGRVVSREAKKKLLESVDA
ncbi:MAG: hypothetical protein U0165_03525 [Polyangiaceae bacterium]